MTGTRALALTAVLLLTGCGAGAGSASTGGTVVPDPSSLSGRDIGLQLRPVLSAGGATKGQCPTASASAQPSPAAAATASPVTACAVDGTIVYSLGAAVVDGTHWESLAVDQRDGAVEIDALLDPVGSSALTKATGDLSTEDEPRNQLAIYAEGRVLAAPMVVQPIYGGTLVITGAYTVEEAQALVDRLTG